jgi:hypothetical protein
MTEELDSLIFPATRLSPKPGRLVEISLAWQHHLKDRLDRMFVRSRFRPLPIMPSYPQDVSERGLPPSAA